MTIQILSLIIALLAVIVGPIITYRITKKNLEFQFGRSFRKNGLKNWRTPLLNFLIVMFSGLKNIED